MPLSLGVHPRLFFSVSGTPGSELLEQGRGTRFPEERQVWLGWGVAQSHDMQSPAGQQDVSFFMLKSWGLKASQGNLCRCEWILRAVKNLIFHQQLAEFYRWWELEIPFLPIMIPIHIHPYPIIPHMFTAWFMPDIFVPFALGFYVVVFFKVTWKTLEHLLSVCESQWSLGLTSSKHAYIYTHVKKHIHKWNR